MKHKKNPRFGAPHLRRSDGVVCSIISISRWPGAPWQARTYTLNCGDLAAKPGTTKRTYDQVTCLGCLAQDGAGRYEYWEYNGKVSY